MREHAEVLQADRAISIVFGCDGNLERGAIALRCLTVLTATKLRDALVDERAGLFVEHTRLSRFVEVRGEDGGGRSVVAFGEQHFAERVAQLSCSSTTLDSMLDAISKAQLALRLGVGVTTVEKADFRRCSMDARDLRRIASSRRE